MNGVLQIRGAKGKMNFGEIPSIIVCFETFVTFRIKCPMLPDVAVNDIFQKRYQELSVTELSEFFRRLSPETELSSEIGGMYVLASHLAEMGFDVTYLGRVGNDGIGRYLQHQFNRRSIKARIKEVPGLHTGVLVVLILEKGQCTYLVVRGANHFLELQNSSKLPESIDESMSSSDIIYLNGYFLFSQNADILVELLIAAPWFSRSQLVIDVGAAAGHEPCLKSLASLFNQANFVKVNRYEAEILTKKQNPYRQGQILAEKLPQGAYVLLSLGAEGALLFVNGNIFEAKTSPGRGTLNLDGAGDVLLASFLQHLLLQGYNPEDSLRRAVTAASRWVSSGLRDRWKLPLSEIALVTPLIQGIGFV
jgi:2-dehydro-3-deoxygluconokinase